MTRILRMEWAKLRTDPGTRWWVLALVTGTLAVSGIADLATQATDCAPKPCALDATRISLTGVYLGQIAAVVLAVLAVGREYETTMIYSTLAACPRRGLVLAAKAGVVLATVTFAAALAIVTVWVAARLIMPGQGFVWPSLDVGPTRRAFMGSILYIDLVALLSLGIAVVVRHAGAAIATTLGLLYLMPVAALFVTDPLWQGRIHRYSPMSAGLAIQDTMGTQPIGPWAGLGVLAAYSAAALLAAAVLFRYRDA